MLDLKLKQNLVAVIGAGPAGLYAAQFLARQGVEVVVFNKDIRPGGLAEYGIFPDKEKMRIGLRAQFQRILEMPNIHYFGNVTIGKSGDLKLDQLRSAGVQAFMVTTGAQQNNWLGIPGEDLEGVYQANDIVFHYNQMPEKSNQKFAFGRNIAVIGMGNVMLDIVHYLKREGKAHTVTAYARRGPAEVKFDHQTLGPVADCLDLDGIQAAVDAARPATEAVGRDVRGLFKLIKTAREKAPDCETGISFQMRFLRSPRRMIGDERGHVKEIVFEVNTLAIDGDQVVSRGTGETETLPADTVIFSIGSRVDPEFGLPVAHGNYVTTPDPRFPIDGISYEVYNPELCASCEDVFVSGWARLASEGVVGLARKDAERGARAVLAYLDGLDGIAKDDIIKAVARFPVLNQSMVNLENLKKIWEMEQNIADARGLAFYKFDSKEAMLRVIRKA